MSDNNIPPAAVPTQFVPWGPTDEQLAKMAERARLQAQRNAEDAARAVAPRVQRVAVAGFTMVSDDFPSGQVINPGETFEISEFDLHKYVGRSVRV